MAAGAGDDNDESDQGNCNRAHDCKSLLAFVSPADASNLKIASIFKRPCLTGRRRAERPANQLFDSIGRRQGADGADKGDKGKTSRSKRGHFKSPTDDAGFHIPAVFRLGRFMARACDLHHTKPHKTVISAQPNGVCGGKRAFVVAAGRQVAGGGAGRRGPGVSKPSFYR